MIAAFCAILFNLAAAHALCDFPLQGPHMARAKRPGGDANIPWPMALGCHALIHGGAVSFLTGIWWLGVAETVAHASIDAAKCRHLFGMRVDQAAHLGCKCVWGIIAVWYFHP